MVNQAFIDAFTTKHPDVTVIAVTKYTDIAGVQAFVDAGMMHFGENRADALITKQPVFPDKTWHFIGHLQTNKVKQVLPYINVLHSLDRVSLADEIEKRATHVLDCFIQVKTTHDEKYGCSIDDVEDLITRVSSMANINIIGFMTMAALHASVEEIKASFRIVKELQKHYGFPYLSIGMSNDYEIAIAMGATHVRLGRILYEGEVHESV
jgi:PLP dependent protein